MQSQIIKQALYNKEANRIMLEILDTVSGDIILADEGSYFSSIFGILNHITVCDMMWIKRFQQLRPESLIPRCDPINHPNLSWEHPLFPDFPSLSEHRKKVDSAICRWFEEFPESDILRPFGYEDSKGGFHETVAIDAFNFFFTHQIHHRGQISQILDSRGVDNNFASNIFFLDLMKG